LDSDINLAATKILDDDDLKKIRVLKLRQAVKKVDRKGFASSSDEESGSEEENEDEDNEEAEEDMSDNEDDEEGEEEEVE
jgi:hypothetical protein